MASFGALLKHHLEQRGLSAVKFAEMVGVSDTTIGSVISGRKAPRLKRAPEWIRALGLKGEEARVFLEEMALAASPEIVQKLVRDLRRNQRD